MNYARIYNSIIKRGRNRTLLGYKEIHHIVPKCIGGTDERDNLVELTPEEHYVAHQLLVKMYPNNHALAKAAKMMTVISSNQQRVSNKAYSWLRKRFSAAMSDSQSGVGNSQYGTIWIHSVELNTNRKIPKFDPIPNGWKKGRVVDFNRLLKKQEEKKIRREEKKIRREEEARYWHDRLVKSEASSIREFVKYSDYDKSHVAFIRMLKSCVPEFNPEHGKSFNS